MRPITTRRHARLLAAAVTTAVVGAGLPFGAPAHAVPDVPTTPDAAGAGRATPQADDRPQPWSRAQDTVEARPAEVVAEAAPRAGASTSLRVVTLRNVDHAPRIEVEQVRGRDRAIAAVSEAQDLPGVVAVDVDTRVHAVGAVSSAGSAGPDPGRSDQWGLDRLAAEAVWDVADGEGAVVAVVDSGVDGDHADLAGRLTATGRDFITGTGDGRVDENGHGTHVAGVVSAVRGNSIGVAGLAPRARIMPVRVLDAEGAGWSSAIARGITHAVDQGAAVVNLSLGGPHQDSVTASAVGYAVSKGVTVVAAVGNDRLDGNATTYPAAYPGVVAVASVDKGDLSSSFSNTGSYVDVAAPGRQILSTVVGGYAFMSGTSMAAPFVSATAALAVAATGGTSSGQVAQALTGTAADLGPRGWDGEFGHGLVSPLAAVRALTASAPAPATQPAPDSTTAPSTAPSPGPDPVPTPAPAPEPDPAVETDPVTEPAPPAPEQDEPTARQELRLTFGSRGGRALAGQTRAVRLHAAHAADGSPVPGQRVVVLGRRGGEVVVRRWVVTDAIGNVQASFRIPATTRFTLRSPATASTAAATSGSSITWRAAPRVRSRHVARAATVRVLDDRGQRVMFQRATGARWVTVAVRALDARGAAVVRGLPRGRIRATVTRVPGLLPVRTRPWTVG